MKRRAFISMIVGAAGGLALPKWRIPDPVIILPPTTPTVGYLYEARALAYAVTRRVDSGDNAEEVADKLYGFGLAPVKSEGGILLYDQFKKVVMPGLLKVWQDHYNDSEFEDLFK